MESNETLQEYLDLAVRYLYSAKLALLEELYEPAMANGIHALEMACKAALTAAGLVQMKTHNIGGLFGQHFHDQLDDDVGRRINRLFMKYHHPRYPGTPSTDPDKVEQNMVFIEEFIEQLLPLLIAEIRE